MLAVLSPARNCRPLQRPGTAPTRPQFMPQALQLARALRQYSPWQLESLLEVNPERALELYSQYRAFNAKQPGSPAILAYYGAAYRNMQPQEFSDEELAFADESLRITSALYGLLRPLDGILPHRLGMTKDFLIDGQSLYAFWGRRVYRALFAGGGPVVSLASNEYTKLFTPYLQPGDTLVTCRFLLQKPEGLRGTVATVRAARGQMARFIVQNRITRPQDLQAFDWDGYRFLPGQSNRATYVFARPRPGLLL